MQSERTLHPSSFKSDHRKNATCFQMKWLALKSKFKEIMRSDNVAQGTAAPVEKSSVAIRVLWNVGNSTGTIGTRL